MKRYALVSYLKKDVNAFDYVSTAILTDMCLPDNYKVEGLSEFGVVISGKDNDDASLQDVVFPTLKKVFLHPVEIKEDHPAVKEVKEKQRRSNEVISF